MGGPMNDARSYIILAIFTLVPYTLVSSAYMALSDGGAKEFWGAFGVLIAIRTFFSLIETLGGVLSWHLYGKKLTVEKFLQFLRTNNFPEREYEHDSFLNYLARIDDGAEYPSSVKAAAKQMHLLLETYESIGILLGARMNAASEVALDIYSPRSRAPVLGATAN
jgi:hypothetical protein